MRRDRGSGTGSRGRGLGCIITLVLAFTTLGLLTVVYTRPMPLFFRTVRRSPPVVINFFLLALRAN